jgi:hypothetical protein
MDIRGEHRAIWSSAERTRAHAAKEKLVDNESSHTPGGACYEDCAHGTFNE